jgi:hypothetical protein
VAHSEAKKWINFVTDNGGSGPDSLWLQRGAGVHDHTLSEAARQHKLAAAATVAATPAAVDAPELEGEGGAASLEAPYHADAAS